MTVRKIWNEGYVLWQTADSPDGCSVPEPAIAVHVDNGGTLVLDQDGREITLNWSSVPELVGLLRDLAKRVTVK